MSSSLFNPSRRAITGFFNLANLRASFSTAFRRRDHGLMPFIALTIAVFILKIFLGMGVGPTFFLYLRKELGWDEGTFGRYIAMFGFVGIFTQVWTNHSDTANTGIFCQKKRIIALRRRLSLLFSWQSITTCFVTLAPNNSSIGIFVSF